MAHGKTIQRGSKSFLVTLAIGLFALWYGAGSAYAADYTWDDGGPADSNWSTPENWSPDGTPGAGDNVIFDSTSNADCIADVVVDNLASISLNSGYTSTLTLNSDFVGGSNELTLTGDLTLDSGTILCKGDTSTANGTGIIINAANVTVGDNGQISANSQGFPGSQGPGSINHQCSGGSHGGYGGALYASSIYPTPYGSVSQPTALGSGGGHNSNGGIGGGAIKLVASNTITINGTVSANGGVGQPYDYGGGAGGSIWIITNILAGSGAIMAEGGNGQRNGHDGGGGRISLQWSSGMRTFDGTISAKSGGRGWATHGTLYVYVPDDPDNSWNELWNQDDPVSGSVALAPGEYDIDHVHITNNATLECQGDTTAINGASGGTAGNPHGSGVTINSDNIIIDEGAAISASYLGFIRHEGPGAAQDNRAGGGHGGYGAGGYAYGGSPYGSVSQPTALGSGGGMSNAGGRGGGAIKLVVSDTITINGTVSANGGGGQAYDTGGGAGGSAWVITDTLAGSGAIAANGGGPNRNGEGAGGGRISLQWATGKRSFNGTISAKNGGHTATNGTIWVPSFLWNELWNQYYHVKDPIALAPGEYHIDYLHITNNATLECQGDATAINEASGGTAGNPHGSGVTINSDNIIIDEGAAISASYLGFIRRQGPGVQVSGNRAGPGHGGKGGDCGGDVGGPTYGSVSAPAALGSGGGSTGGGGRGGGAIKLVVDDTITINGTVSANADHGHGYDVSGGAGGSIWIITDTLTGFGAMTALGGAPRRNASGGGGGRIAVYFSNSPSSLGPLSQSTSVAGNTAAYPGTVVWSPIGGYTEENTIPESQCVKSADGMVTITFKVKDPGDEINGTPYNTNHILRNFEYRVDGGDWNAPRHGDSSLCLGGGWPDNSGSSYTAASAFADATEYSFTWNTLDPDLSGIFDDQGVENVEVRFMVRDTVTQDGDTYYIDSVSYVVSDNWEYDNGVDHPAPAPSTDDGDGGGGSNCFIATAAYGSCMEPHVMILKDFRDTYLIPCVLGRTFVRTYYKYSPQLAQFISRHEMLRTLVRISILPLVGVSYATLHLGPVVTLAMFVVLLMTPIFLVSFCRRKAPAVQSWSRNK